MPAVKCRKEIEPRLFQDRASVSFIEPEIERYCSAVRLIEISREDILRYKPRRPGSNHSPCQRRRVGAGAARIAERVIYLRLDTACSPERHRELDPLGRRKVAVDE